MPAFLDGLRFYEILLIVLGVLLFITCLILFIINNLKDKKTKYLLYFFGLAVAMIAWPGIVKLQIDKEGIQLEKAVQSTETQLNEANIKELENVLDTVPARDFNNVQINKNLTKAYLLIGEDMKAEKILNNKLLPTTSDDPEIKDLNTTINTLKDLKSKINLVEKKRDTVQK